MPAATLRFSDGTEAAGIRFVHENGRSPEKFYAEQMGVGAIFFDADGDGDQDLYLLNGKRLAEKQLPEPRNAFYVNDGTGRFTDATAGSGLGDPRFGMGVCGGDYDNDGDVDLHVTNFGGDNALYRNEGNLFFVDVAAEAGVAGEPGLASSSAFCDVDRDGFLDLYVAYCLDHTLENNRECARMARDRSGRVRRYCNPMDYHPLPDRLYRNRGDGTFEDVSDDSGITSALGRSLGVAFSDCDGDGDPDLLVACDRTRNLFYENDGAGRFHERGVGSGTAVSPAGKIQAGMGIVTGDLDGDLQVDVAITYFERELNGFYMNRDGTLFQDVAERNGTGKEAYALLAWGVQFFDADLDTDPDVFVGNGHFLDNVEVFREPIAGYEQPNLLYENLGDGVFRSVGKLAGSAMEIEKVSRGVATADVDNDGDVDVLVCNLHDRPDLLINETPRDGRHWLSVRLIGTVSNRDGIGARVTVHLSDKKVMRELFSGQSYLSQSELRLHFGLGTESVVPRLEVRWPSGRTSVLEDVAADRFVEVVEPAE